MKLDIPFYVPFLTADCEFFGEIKDELIENMDIDDFFDEIHTSISGSKKIATVIYPSLEKIFNENNY